MRLELCVGLIMILCIIFQFHKGAIRTRGGASDVLVDGNFNSIKVRLEHALSARLLTSLG